MKAWKDYRDKYHTLIYTMDLSKVEQGVKKISIRDMYLEAFLIVNKHQALLLEDLNSMLFDESVKVISDNP